MLAVDIEGAQKLCALLRHVRRGETVSDARLRDVLASNAFFVDFYSQWDGLDKQTIAAALVQFDEPGRNTGSLADRLMAASRERTRSRRSPASSGGTSSARSVIPALWAEMRPPPPTGPPPSSWRRRC